MKNEKLSRRDFLKLTAATSTGAALAGLGPLSSIAAPKTRSS